MARMSRTDERQAALRFCIVALGWLACLFAWASLLSFSAADNPATVVWPNPSPADNLCGSVGAWIAYQAFHYVGFGAYPLLLLCNAAIIAWSRRARLNDLWLRAIGAAFVCTACATLSAMAFAPAETYLLTGPGGVLGTATAGFLQSKLHTLGTALILALSLLVGLVLAADNLLVATFRGLRWAGQHSGPVLARGGTAVTGASAAVASGVAALSQRLSEPRATETADDAASPPEPSAPEPDSLDEDPEVEEAIDLDEFPDEEPASPPTIVKPAAKAANAAKTGDPSAAEAAGPLFRAIGRQSSAPKPAARRDPRPPSDDDYNLPPIDLLERSPAVDKGAIETLCREKAYILEQTLNEFRLAVEVVAIETGPVITVFELKLAPGIKVSQIASLTNDMARALKAPAVRVVAPLPGKNTIGIEVPNIDKEKVRLRDVMEMAASRIERLTIPLFLGKDASGQPLATDLTRMPHLLIAGTTGSGKSVCISSLIMSMLLTRTPEEVNLVLVDPKVVELAAYKDIPHLMCPIVTEVAKAEAILDWASTKMDERYELLAEAGVKDIQTYNRLGYDGLCERLQPSCPEEMERIPIRLPYIVIIIDELADLMMTSAK